MSNERNRGSFDYRDGNNTNAAEAYRRETASSSGAAPSWQAPSRPSSSPGGTSGGSSLGDSCKIPMKYRRYWMDGRITDTRVETLKGFVKAAGVLAVIAGGLLFSKKNER